MSSLQAFARYIFHNKWAQNLAAAVTAATAATVFAGFGAFQAVEAMTEDARVAYLTPAAPPHPQIVIVGIDEGTLDALAYRSPIDRRFLSQLIERIAAHGPRVIGLDVMLDRATEPEADAALRETLARHRGRIVLVSPRDGGADLPPARQQVWAAFRDVAIAADGALVLSRRDRTVRTQIPADAQGAPHSFSAAIAAAAGAAPPRGRLTIPFSRPADAQAAWPFTTYAAHHALAVPPQLGWFRDKIVIIGAILEEEDRFATPLRLIADAPDTIPGVVVHAYQAAQLIDGVEMRRAPRPIAIALTALFAVLGLAAGAMFIGWGLLSLTIAGAALVHVFAAFAMFTGAHVLLPVVAPIFALMFGGAGGAALAARRNAAGRRALDQAFRHYLAPEIVDEIMRRPERFKIDGEERDITILVTDIEGFTAMLGEGETRVLAEAFNGYFDALIDAVIAHGGAVDKIVGDGLFALFGAPVSRSDHAALAVRCALAIDAIGERFRREHAALGFGRTRVGVTSGLALVGSFGGARRINYTAYGRIVNLADRLQAANKVIGTRILISAATAAQLHGAPARPVGTLLLRGVAGGEPVFEPGVAADAVYTAAFAALESGAPEALALFEAACAADAHDALSAFHLARLRRGETGAHIDLRPL